MGGAVGATPSGLLGSVTWGYSLGLLARVTVFYRMFYLWVPQELANSQGLWGLWLGVWPWQQDGGTAMWGHTPLCMPRWRVGSWQESGLW